MTFHRYLPLGLGALMGLAMPWMLHMQDGALTGVAFALAHLVPIGLIAATALISKRVRHYARSILNHVSQPRLLGLKLAGFAGGWAIICAYCLMIGGTHWT